MDTSDLRKHMHERVLKNLQNINFQDPDWHKPFTDFDPVTKHNIVMWYLKELVEKHEYVDEIFALAKIYAMDADPGVDDKYVGNKRIEEGEEISNITSVRGVACWLLASIAATFRTEFYPEIISLLEKLTSDPVYYVRMQATVTLSFFAANIRARQHQDGTIFDFKDEDRKTVLDLSLKMLIEHRDMPRVLENVVRIFEVLRGLPEAQARQVIDILFYNSKGELQPSYITRQGVPLLIFFAEYRSTFGDGFDGTWFQNYAEKILALSEKEAPYLRSTFEWHVWKEIEKDAQSYEKLKKYMPLFLHEDEFEQQPLTQYDFLILQVLKVAPQDGVELFQQLLNYIETWAHEYDIREHAWMLSGGEVIEAIAPIAPERLIPMLAQIKRIFVKGVWIGNIEQMFKAYKLIPNVNTRDRIYPELKKLYEEFQSLDRVGKLGEL